MSSRIIFLRSSRLFLAGSLLLLAGFFSACRSFKPALRPAGEIRGVEGYASLRLSRGGESSRAKFAFAVALPDRARLEVFDALGRAVSLFLIRGDEAYLVIPSEKAYWKGERDEVISKFLGFPIHPAEILGLLSGHWTEKASARWVFVRDDQGRIVSGARDGLEIRILEYFPKTDLPRRWSFRQAGTEGSIVLLEAAFDRPEPDFSLGFLRTFSSKTWPEIERLLR